MKIPVWLKLTLLLIAATAVQGVFASRLRWGGVQPDWNKVVLICIAVHLSPLAAMAYGFVAGGLMGIVVGMSVGSYLVSRMVLGVVLALLEMRVFRHDPPVLVFSALAGSLLCEVVFFLFSPQPDVARWTVQALGESGYNLLFVLPIAWWVRRIIPPKGRLKYI